jgi:hypothetical protein
MRRSQCKAMDSQAGNYVIFSFSFFSHFQDDGTAGMSNCKFTQYPNTTNGKTHSAIGIRRGNHGQMATTTFIENSLFEDVVKPIFFLDNWSDGKQYFLVTLKKRRERVQYSRQRWVHQWIRPSYNFGGLWYVTYNCVTNK